MTNTQDDEGMVKYSNIDMAKVRELLKRKLASSKEDAMEKVASGMGDQLIKEANSRPPNPIDDSSGR